MKYFKLMLVTFLALVLLDFLWFGFIAHQLYHEEYGSLFRMANGTMAVNYFSAFIVYILMSIGIICFVLKHAKKNCMQGFLYGGIFGLVLYGVFNFTNFALISGFSLKIAIIDTLWGIVVCALVGAWAAWFA